MVSYPITFPTTIHVNSLTLTPRNAVTRSESSFTYVEQVYDYGGSQWVVSGSLPLMNRDIAETYLSFIFKLRGRKGTFLFPLPQSIASPRGSWGGTPLVDGAGQTGDTLDIKGLPLSQTACAKAGDFINLGTGVNTRLYKILDDADSDGSGNMTVNIWPNLRSSPSDGASVVYQDVAVLLRLAGDVPHDIDINKNYFIAFDAAEALNGT